MKERFLDKIRRVFSNLVYKFKESQFVAHISFLWHWKNFFFCLRYPFWKCSNALTSKFLGYSLTWYDYIPKGWQKAFGKQLSKDIKKAGKESRRRLGYKSWKNLISWQQIKEKYGELRLYASASDEIMHVLEKYELLSSGYCIGCGKPARYMTQGWIEYVCKECFVEGMRNVTDEDKERLLQERRLTKKDIPSMASYSKNKQGKVIKHKVNIKKIYGIDFEELWDLKK